MYIDNLKYGKLVNGDGSLDVPWNVSNQSMLDLSKELGISCNTNWDTSLTRTTWYQTSQVGSTSSCGSNELAKANSIVRVSQHQDSHPKIPIKVPVLLLLTEHFHQLIHQVSCLLNYPMILAFTSKELDEQILLMPHHERSQHKKGILSTSTPLSCRRTNHMAETAIASHGMPFSSLAWERRTSVKRQFPSQPH